MLAVCSEEHVAVVEAYCVDVVRGQLVCEQHTTMGRPYFKVECVLGCEYRVLRCVSMNGMMIRGL